MENSSNLSLKYKDEADRAFGAAGMTVAVVVCNADELIVAVDLDADDPADIMELTDDYYLAGSRAKSVSAAWKQTLSAFRATVVMAAGNILARHLVGQEVPVSPSIRDLVREAVADDGLRECQLEPDEADEIF